MKRLLFSVLVLAGGTGTVMAQQRPHYTQYVLNNFILNPAVAGIENYVDLKVSHRHQWVGLEGAPVTTYLSVHGPWKRSDDEIETATSVRSGGENPRGRSFVADYTAPSNHHGVGFTVLNDRTGPLNRFTATAAYAYHIGIGPKTSMSVGLSAGVQNMTLNTNKLNFVNTQVDPAVYGSGYLNRIAPDVNAGVWLYSPTYFVGLAAQNIFPSKLSYSADTVSVQSGKLVPHLFFTAGYRTFLSDDISLIPSVQLRYMNPAPVGLDINAKLQFRDFIWAGASYRVDDGVAGMFGLNISSAFNLGYSYDFTTSRLNTVSRGSHEIVLGFLLGNRYGDWCPRNTF